MGLREVLAQAATVAFRAAGNIPEAVTLRHYTGTFVRNPVTGFYTRTLVDRPCEGIFTDISERQGREGIEFGDRLCLLRAAQSGVVESGDMILRGSEAWEVLSFKLDPAAVLYECLIRLKKQVVNAGPPGPPSVGSSYMPFTPYEFTYADVSPALIYTIPSLTLVKGVELTIRTGFNGSGPTISVGTAGQPERLLAIADNLPATPGTYAVPVDFDLPAGTAVNLYVSPGFGATQGDGVVLLDLLAQ